MALLYPVNNKIMRQTTVEKVIKLTSTFYQTISQSFDQTRKSSWAGWEQLTPFFVHDCKVLDVGCGNGRFAQFLSERMAAAIDYTGIDGSKELLISADHLLQKQAHIAGFKLAHTDLFTHLVAKDQTYSAEMQRQKFSHVCLFGLLHHVPTMEHIHQLLIESSELIQPGGYLLLSLWQPLNQPLRYAKKQLNPSDFGLDAAEFKANDLLLGWQDRRDIARFCHSFSNPEIEQIITVLKPKLSLVTRFQADGKTGNLNTYLVFQTVQKTS